MKLRFVGRSALICARAAKNDVGRILVLVVLGRVWNGRLPRQHPFLAASSSNLLLAQDRILDGVMRARKFEHAVERRRCKRRKRWRSDGSSGGGCSALRRLTAIVVRLARRLAKLTLDDRLDVRVDVEGAILRNDNFRVNVAVGEAMELLLERFAIERILEQCRRHLLLGRLLLCI